MFFKSKEKASIRETVEANTGIATADFLKERDIRSLTIDRMDEAVDLAKRFIRENAKPIITIVGDYDSDGVNATAIMYHALSWYMKEERKEGLIRTRLPKRFSEGYGLSVKIVDEIGEGLLITVDNGISALDAVKAAKAKGLTVIVTDHHLPVFEEERMILPEADVVVDPHIKEEGFSSICGAAIAYVFASRLLPGKDLDTLKVLAGIATVTDVMPLLDVNRTLVKESLVLINGRKVVPGLNTLLERIDADNNLDEYDYGFKVGPLFNAPGRLVDDGANRVLQLLKATRSDTRKRYLADHLYEKNEERKERAKEAMDKQGGVTDRPCVVYDPTLGEGIIGLVAGRLCEKLYSPTICFTDAEEEGLLKGSGRSTDDVHLKQVLDGMNHLIVKYGGHAGAAGLTIRKTDLEEFTQTFKALVGTLAPRPVQMYDLELPASYSATMAELSLFSPFGEGNPRPVFHSIFRIDSCNVCGDGTHIMLKDGELKIMGFGLAERYISTRPKTIEGIGYLSESWYNGEKTYSFELIDFRECVE